MCKKCDVKVSIIKDYEFNKDSDYLFFWTNFGNQNLLKKNMKLHKGTVSYYCGCSGFSLS